MKTDIDKYVPVFANNPLRTVLPRSGYDSLCVMFQSEDHSRSFSRGSLISGNLFLGNGRSEKPNKGGWCTQKISNRRNLCSLVSLERQWKAECCQNPGSRVTFREWESWQAHGGIWTYREDQPLLGTLYEHSQRGKTTLASPQFLASLLLLSGLLPVLLTGWAYVKSRRQGRLGNAIP